MNVVARFRLMVAVSATLILASALMIAVAEGFPLWSVTTLSVFALMAAVALFLAWKAMKDLRNGIPLQDERSQALRARASHLSFYVSAYLILGLAVVFIPLEDRDITMPISELLFFLVAIMGSIHITISTYYNRKGAKALR